MHAYLLRVFERKHPHLAPQKSKQGGKVHHEFTTDAKAALHRLVQQEATLDDLAGVVALVHMIRSMFNLAGPAD